MGYEDLEDAVNDADYQNALVAMNLLTQVYVNTGNYESAQRMYASWKRVSQDYINFRMEKFDSEARKVVSEAYKALGYNPNNPRQLGKGDKK